LLVHGQAAVIGGCVEPASALGVERVVVRRRGAVRDRPLLGRQRTQPGAGRLGHIDSGLVARVHIA